MHGYQALRHVGWNINSCVHDHTLTTHDAYGIAMHGNTHQRRWHFGCCGECRGTQPVQQRACSSAP
eukprot:11185483-Lingulodinium_polyedra.AAC.1